MPQSRVTDPKELQKSPLGELDFNRIIGGPLSACVNAQEEAAQATLDYLNGVVFRKKDDDESCLEPVTMTFYLREEEWSTDSLCRCSASCLCPICESTR